MSRAALASVFACAVAIAAGMLSAGASGSGSIAPAAATVGLQGPSFSGTSSPTGTKRAESSVWWNDGSWWANMWDAKSRDFHIFRFAVRHRVWVDTGTLVDRRTATRADVLWSGKHLFVASHFGVPDLSSSAPGPPAYLYRFSYNHKKQRYTLDRGFPTVINRQKTETLVIDQDSAGRLWATWQQVGKIYVSHTVPAPRPKKGQRKIRGTGWGIPFTLSFPQATVTVDDISALVAFSGRIGVMWSDQNGDNDGFWFSTHLDKAPDNAWSAPEAALSGGRSSDDHINLHSDSRGAVYAAVKTSKTRQDPLMLLLARDAAGHGWTDSVYGLASDCNNRPTLQVDQQRQLVRMFATGPAEKGCTRLGGAIYEKDAPLDGLTFPSGHGTPVIDDPTSPFISNATTSKRNVPTAAGTVVLAVNRQTKRYWTAYEPAER